MRLDLANKDDERMRLDRTICRWDGDFVYVKTSFDEDMNHVFIKRLKQGARTILVDCSDPRFDASAPRLGWFFYGGQTYWLIRKPRRQFKAGLPLRQTVQLMTIGAELGQEADLTWVPEHWMTSPDMNKCLEGYNYTIKEALGYTLLNGSSPINRRFALKSRDGRYIEIHYCGRCVGHLDTVDMQPRLWDGPDASFIVREFNRIKEQ